MKTRNPNTFIAVLMILLGLGFLLDRVADFSFEWPFYLLAVGIAFLARFFIEGRRDSIFTGTLLTLLGLLFLAVEERWSIFRWQDSWPLIPGAVGLAFLADYFFHRRRGGVLGTAILLMAVSAVFIMTQNVRADWIWDVFTWWPVGLLGLGVWLLVRPDRGRESTVPPSTGRNPSTFPPGT